MESFTILIPTYNRHDYLCRLLRYYDSFGKPFKIIVSDSSDKDIKAKNRALISSMNNVRIEYVDKYGPDVNPHYKFYKLICASRTKYSVFCADDDFTIPNGIIRSMNFLESHPDYVCVMGKSVSFGYKRNKLVWEAESTNESIPFDDVSERLNYHLSHYQALFYAVYETRKVRMIHEELIRNNINHIMFGELFLSMMTSIYGKTKVLDVLYSVRQFDSPYASGVIWPKLYSFMGKPIYRKEYARFREVLSAHIADTAEYDKKESKQIIDVAFSKYLKLTIKKIYKIKIFFDSLHLPRFLDETIRRTYRFLFLPRRKRYVPRREFLEELKKVELVL